jgi:hypothetical protein
VNDVGKIGPDQGLDLGFDLLLDVRLDSRHRVEARADMETFESVVFDNQGDALLPRNDEGEYGAKLKGRQLQSHWHYERSGGEERRGVGQEGMRRHRISERIGLAKRASVIISGMYKAR